MKRIYDGAGKTIKQIKQSGGYLVELFTDDTYILHSFFQDEDKPDEIGYYTGSSLDPGLERYFGLITEEEYKEKMDARIEGWKRDRYEQYLKLKREFEATPEARDEKIIKYDSQS